MVIGLLMTAHDEDILERTLTHNAALVDCFYALDGGAAKQIIVKQPNCSAYLSDFQCGEGPARDGWRQVLHRWAVADHGPEHLFVLLHGDEMWMDAPRDIADDNPGFDGFMLRLPIATVSGDLIGPGVPEFRMFWGSDDVAYDWQQHFNVQPAGLDNVKLTHGMIAHVPWRSVASQRLRQAHHRDTGFDPDNHDRIYMHEQEIIDHWLGKEHYQALTQVEGLL